MPRYRRGASIAALSGSKEMTSFKLSVQSDAPLGLQIRAVSFDVANVMPEPASLALAGSAAGSRSEAGNAAPPRQASAQVRTSTNTATPWAPHRYDPSNPRRDSWVGSRR